MRIRNYTPSDCRDTAALFYSTIHTINARDYTQAQLTAWAAGSIDLAAWNASLLSHHTVVAVEGQAIVGFGDITETGYIDRLYIHKDYQRRGIASAICDALESAIPAGHYTVHASITARPFFEARGYRVVKQQMVERRGISLTNFVMEKR